MGKWNLIIYAPAYNVEKSIVELIERMSKVAKKLEKKEVFLNSFLVVNDGSTDGTLGLLSDMKEKCGFLEILNKEKNEGATQAILDGMRRVLEIAKEKGVTSEKTIFVRMDSDLEHQPEDLPNLLFPIMEGRTGVSVGFIPFDERSGIDVKQFNEMAGLEESRKFLGIDIPQFCPGFNAIRGDVFLKTYPELMKASNDFENVFGEAMLAIDFVMLFVAKKSGWGLEVIRLAPIQDKWIKETPSSKISYYLNCHKKTMQFLDEY